jgi:molybdopterin synthase catalytic subunit
MVVDARLAEQPLDAEAEFARFLRGLSDEGAVVSFVGLARPRSGAGNTVARLFLDYHPRLTEKSLNEIAEAAADRFDVTAVKVVHRCGEVAPGQPIVFVAAASAHRRAAFEAADYMMDRLKTEAVFWKREDASDGARWIEPTDADRAERKRWGD